MNELRIKCLKNETKTPRNANGITFLIHISRHSQAFDKWNIWNPQK